MSFRLKLALAMLLAVAAVTGVTMLVMRESVEATYRRMFEERFESDVSLLAALQSARLGPARSRCLGLAKSVRLIAAMEEEDAALLYRIALDELRDVLAPPPGSPGLRPATFFRFVEADGRVLTTTDQRAGLGGAPGRARWEEEQVARVGTALTGADEQQVGYLAPEVEGRRTLQEVVVTRIVDPVGQRRLGAVAVGFPVDDFGESSSGGPRQIRSGIWIEGRLYTRTIPESVWTPLSAALARPADHAEPVVVIEGIPHRVFRRTLAEGPAFPPAEQVGLYSLAEPLARERDLRARMLTFGGLAVALALVSSLALSHGLAVPIRELASAAARVGRGDLGVTVPVRSHDELGRLALAFNEMAAGLALKERYRSVLDMVADREVAEDLIAGRLTLGGELREVSVLFCDVRGFAALTERMEPREVIALLNEHMTTLTRVVHANGGVVDKFVGDQVIALFGAPRSTEQDASAAVRTAWQMIEARAALNARTARPLEIGIGIASGTVVAGCLGSADRLNYTVLGARVNLAARLCAQADRMEVLIDDPTRRRLGVSIEVDAVPPLALKGFSAPVVAYRLRGVASLPAAS